MKYDLQKADMWKRISAWIFDKILVFILVVGSAFLLSYLFDFNEPMGKYEARQQFFSEQYGTDLSMSAEDYEKLAEADKERFDSAIKALNADEDAAQAVYLMFNYSLIMIVFSFLIAYLVLEFAVPLLFGNGQTLGKKIFGIAVMRIDGVKVSPVILFIRSVLGKYTIETMIPVLVIVGIGFGLVGIVGIGVAAIILIGNVVMVIASATNSPIHDLISNTVTVDMSAQMIFDTKDAMIEHKQKIHEESVEKAPY